MHVKMSKKRSKLNIQTVNHFNNGVTPSHAISFNVLSKLIVSMFHVNLVLRKILYFEGLK